MPSVESLMLTKAEIELAQLFDPMVKRDCWKHQDPLPEDERIDAICKAQVQKVLDNLSVTVVVNGQEVFKEVKKRVKRNSK